MTINKAEQNGTVTLKPDGWLDTASSPDLGNAVESVESAQKLVIDLDAVEYMSSAGLRQIVAAHKKAASIGATFAVTNAGQEVMSIFKMTGIDKKLDITAK